MINFEIVKLSDDGKSIRMDLSSPDGYKFDSLKKWNEDNYKSYTTALDITHLMRKTDNRESLNITFLQTSTPDFRGLYFFEATARNAATGSSLKDVVAIGNLTQYHTCLINKLLAVDIEKERLTFKGECPDDDDWADCYPCQQVRPDCPDCGNHSAPKRKKCNEIEDDCGNSIFFINALLGQIYRTLLQKEYELAAKMLNRIKDAAENCCTFGQEKDTHILIYVENNRPGLCVQKITRS